MIFNKRLNPVCFNGILLGIKDVYRFNLVLQHCEYAYGMPVKV